MPSNFGSVGWFSSAVAVIVFLTAAIPTKTYARSLDAEPMLAQVNPIGPGENKPQSCISGYPDGTYQGDRPLTRNEFAAALNTCLQMIEQEIPASTANFATKADLEVLIKRQLELNTELTELGERVNSQPEP